MSKELKVMIAKTSVVTVKNACINLRWKLNPVIKVCSGPMNGDLIISLLMSPLLRHRPSLWITHKEIGP
jgi:hypothetical protein